MAVREQNRRNSILLGQDNNALTWLIILNADVFVSLLFSKLVYLMSNGGDTLGFQTQILDSITLPATSSRFLNHPWSIITYMFTHDSIWYLISSLFWLWCFG